MLTSDIYFFYELNPKYPKCSFDEPVKPKTGMICFIKCHTRSAQKPNGALKIYSHENEPKKNGCDSSNSPITLNSYVAVTYVPVNICLMQKKSKNVFLLFCTWLNVQYSHSCPSTSIL